MFEGYSSQVDLEVGTIKGGEESYDVSGHLNIPINDQLAVRVVGFYNDEGGWVDNVPGETFMGDRDNADLVEDDFNDFETYGGRIAARWMINPQWETTLSLISQWSRAGRQLGVGPGTRRLQDHAFLQGVARGRLVPDVAQHQGRSRLRRPVGHRFVFRSQRRLRMGRHDL